MTMDAWISWALGIIGTLQVTMIGLLIRVMQRQAAIEAALGIRETPDAREGRDLRMQAQARKVCEGPHDCAYRETTGVRTMPTDPGVR